MSKKGKIRIVGTILHQDALLERLMPENQIPKTLDNPRKFLQDDGIRVTSTYTKAIWKSVRYRAHNHDYSLLLWPSFWPKERLLQVQNAFLADGNPDGYSREYLNVPIDSSYAFFKEQDFLPIDKELRKQPKEIYIGCDFAIAKDSRSDYTVFSVVEVYNDGSWIISDMRKGRWDADEILNEMYDLYVTYRPIVFLLEHGVIFLTMETMLEKMISERARNLNYESVVSSKDKEARAAPLQQRMRSGRVQFDMDSHWFDDLYDEMTMFPRSVHDDMVDSLTIIGMYLKNVTEPESAVSKAEMEFFQDYQQWGDSDEGVNSITGY